MHNVNSISFLFISLIESFYDLDLVNLEEVTRYSITVSLSRKHFDFSFKVTERD